MLPKQFRLQLRSKPDFFKQAEILRYPLFNLFIVKRDDGSPAFSVVVSKKIAAKAAERIRIKRLISRSISDSIQSVAGVPADIVVVAKHPVSSSSHQEISEAMEKAFLKIGSRLKAHE